MATTATKTRTPGAISSQDASLKSGRIQATGDGFGICPQGSRSSVSGTALASNRGWP